MTEEWRIFLYPLGFLSAIAFSGRFLVQWLNSEYHQKSIVPRLFWQISVVGHALLLMHSALQLQFHVAIIQTSNLVIAWRNINLMNKTKKPLPLTKVLIIFSFALTMTTLSFWVQSLASNASSITWIRIPTGPWNASTSKAASWWHLIGLGGMLMMSIRFWLQWWHAEKHKKSSLSEVFWWTSLSGALLSVIYFVRIGDTVNFIGPAWGMIPYIRNLMLLKKNPSPKPSGG